MKALQNIKKNLRRLLGWFGFNYCTVCGKKLEYKYTKGYDEYDVYDCPDKCR